jgi:type IV secretory pathway TrbL component
VEPESPLRRPQTFGGVVYLVVLAMALLGLVIIVVGSWRTGLIWIGAGLLVAGVVRLMLTERASGMLRVRRKWSDVLVLTGGGVALVVLALVIPSQARR